MKLKVQKALSKRSARTREREQQILELRAKGFTGVAIAKELGITQQAVSKALIRMDEDIYREHRQKHHRLKVEQHQRLEWLWRQNLLMLHRSLEKQVKQTTIAEVVPLGPEGHPVAGYVPGKPTIKRTEVAARDGNVAFISEGRAIVGAIAKLWGLNAPTRLTVTREPTEEEKMTDAALLVQAERELADLRRALPELAEEFGAVIDTAAEDVTPPQE